MPAATAATYLECGEVVTSRLLWALLSGAVLVTGALAVAPIYMTPAYTPDEAWFGAAAAGMADQLETLGLWNFVRFQSNFLGYGKIWEYVKAHPKLEMADDYEIRGVTLDRVDLVYFERR